MVYGMVWRREGKIRWARVEEAAAEAKKADGASCPALQIHRPPWLTGREAWSQAGSLSWKCILTKAGGNGFEQRVILRELWGEETGGGTKCIKQPGDGNGVAEKKKGIMCMEVLQPVSHNL